MPLTALYEPAYALEQLAALVVASPAFVARCSDGLPALHVTHPYLRDSLQDLRPFAVFRLPDGNACRFVKAASGAVNQFTIHGQTILQLGDEIADASAVSARDEHIDFLNFAGGVVSYLLSQAGLSDNCNITGIEYTIPPSYTTATEIAGRAVTVPTYVCELLISWGTY